MSEDLINRLADLQELCRRAHIILSENWDDYVEDGLGPSTLLRDLKEASQGRESKDLTVINDLIYKICEKQRDRIKELEDKQKLNSMMPCPTCHSAVTPSKGVEDWSIGCDNGPCLLPYVLTGYPTENEAVAAWNKHMTDIEKDR